MRKVNSVYFFWCTIIVFSGCKKNNDNNPAPPTQPTSFSLSSFSVNGISNGYTYYGIKTNPVIKFSFTAPIDQNSVNNAFSYKNSSGASVALSSSFENNDSTIVIQPASPLSFITKYVLSVSTALKSKAGGSLKNAATINLMTAIDSSINSP